MQKITKHILIMLSLLLFMSSQTMGQSKWAPVIMDEITTFVPYQKNTIPHTPIKTLKDTYNVNETISVTVDKSLLTGKDDRVGVYRKNDKQEWDWDVVRKWQWTPIANTYQLTLGDKDLPAGEYEIRLYTDFSSHSMPKAKYSFRITNPPIKTLKKVYNVNETISVTVDKSLLTGKDDRVGVYRKNDKQEWDWDVVRKWQWTPIANTYQLTLGDKDLPAGEYEIRLYTDFSSHPMPKASYAFSVSGGNNNYVYGSEGQYMDDVQIDETEDYIIYYPKNNVEGAPLVLFAGYYKATKMDDGRFRNEGAMRYLASLGCCVIGNKRVPASWTNAEDFLDVFTTVNLPIPNGVNKDKFAIVGHSTGGMASYYMMQEFKKKGYGADKSFIINIHGWTASSMNKDQLEMLNVDSLILAYGGDEGLADEVGNVNQDPRVLLTISHLLPNNAKKAFVVLKTKNHYYHWGEYAEADARQYGPLKDKKDFLKPVDAMVKYEFFNESGKYNSANEILFAPYVNTIARVKNATLNYLNGRTSLEVYGNYSCEKARNYGIDYCSE